MKSRSLIIFALFLLIAPLSWAQVEVPEEELAKESVLPRFERGEAVKNRAIVTEGKFEFGAYGGWNFTEAIYNQAKVGFNLGYHASETHGFVLNFSYWMPGRNSQYTDLLRQQSNLDFGRTPDLQFAIWGNWELKAYYGKISWTKRGVMNLHLYPILGVGIAKYVHKPYPGLNFGFGQKFYFSKAFALRMDFKLQYQQGPNPFLGNGHLVATNPIPDPGLFGDKWTLGTILDVGVSIML